MTAAKLEHRLIELETLPTAALTEQWERVYKAPAPNLSPDLLKLGIAYRLQERKLGGLRRGTVNALKAVSPSGTMGPQIKSGTRLVRSWNGQTISVLVCDDGFQFDGQTYRSLSAIAREVTGTAWSGPRFFGIGGVTQSG